MGGVIFGDSSQGTGLSKTAYMSKDGNVVAFGQWTNDYTTASSTALGFGVVRAMEYRLVSQTEWDNAKKAASEDIVDSKSATFIHPSNNMDVILGQGTAAKELIEQYGSFDHILVPIGGGGLIAGSALAVKYFGNNCTVIGTEPFEVDDAYRSLISGKIETNISTNTIADGLRTQLGDKNFPIILNEVKNIIRITEDEIIDSMKLIWQRLKIICEPSCSLPLAGILKNKNDFKGKKIGVVITGGNIDLSNLPF